MMPKRERPGQKQVNWWLPDELVTALKDYQHEKKMDHLQEAAIQLLQEGLSKPKGS